MLFEPTEPGGELKAVPLASGFELGKGEYVSKRSMRDFFYLLDRPASR